MRVLARVVANLVLVAGVAAQAPTVSIAGFDPDKGSFPTEGQATKVTLSGAQPTEILVTYRPTSLVEASEKLEIAADGSAMWTPSSPGLAKLTVAYSVDGKAAEIKELVSVQFASTLSMGVWVMALAGIVLFGGAFVSIRALLRRGSEADV